MEAFLIFICVSKARSFYIGDTTVSTEAAALPEVAGKGTLTNLRIAMTDSPTLLDAVEDVLPLLDTLDLSAMRTAIRPLLTEWREAVDVPAGTAGTVARGDVLVLTGVSVTGGAQVYDFAYLASDTEGTYLKLASGDDVLDENGDPITRPQATDILAQDTDSGQEWTTLTGEEIQFIERYEGNALPIGLEDSNTGEQAIGVMVAAHNLHGISERI